MVTVWQFEYALPDGAKWALNLIDTGKYAQNEPCHVRTQLIIYSSADLARSVSYSRMDSVEKYTKEFSCNWAFLLFPNCWHFHRLVAAERLTDRTFSAATKRGKISDRLALNSRRKCNNVQSFSAAFCAQSEDFVWTSASDLY